MVPHLTNVEGERKEIRLIIVRAELTLGVLVSIGRIMQRLVLGAVLRGRRVVVALLIRLGHIRTRYSRKRGQGEGECKDGGPFISLVESDRHLFL